MSSKSRRLQRKMLLDCVFEKGEDRDAAVHEEMDVWERGPRMMSPPPPPATVNNSNGSGNLAAATTAVATAVLLSQRARRRRPLCLDLVSIWGHASSVLTDKTAQAAFSVLQVAVLDTACNLVADGFLNNNRWSRGS